MGDRHADTGRRHAAARSGEELLFNRDLGARLRDRRSEAAMTQDQLAAQAGMTRGSIANIERGEQMPGLYRLLLICTALRCELQDVMPTGSFSAESVASTMSDHYSSAVQKVRRQARLQEIDKAGDR